jgi:dihydrolipoamide dehydrogenase
LDQLVGRENATDFNMVPGCVFTFPEIASIGLTKSQAKEKFEDVNVVKSMYSANGKANAMGEDGFVQLIIVDDRLVGASILGYSASTIIHEIALIIGSEKPLSSFRDVIFAHPTLSEVLAHAIRH